MLLRLASLCVLMVFTVVLQAQQEDRGELLYGNHCISCHNNDLHTRSDRVVHNLEQLRHQVRRWAESQKLSWDNSEVEAVTEFLDADQYHFTK